MPKYRVTFHNGPKGNKSADVDVVAATSDDAMAIALRQHGGSNALRAQGFTGICAMELVEGPKVIGIEIECQDTYFMSYFHDYIFILAIDEAQAVKYYTDHLKGKRFNFDACKENPKGKCVRGKVISTYFAIGSKTAPFDATR